MPTNTALNQSLETDTNLPNGNVNGKKIGSFRSFDANF